MKVTAKNRSSSLDSSPILAQYANAFQVLRRPFPVFPNPGTRAQKQACRATQQQLPVAVYNILLDSVLYTYSYCCTFCCSAVSSVLRIPNAVLFVAGPPCCAAHPLPSLNPTFRDKTLGVKTGMFAAPKRQLTTATVHQAIKEPHLTGGGSTNEGRHQSEIPSSGP